MLVDNGPFRRAALKSYISRWSSPNPNGIFDDVVAGILKEQGFVWEESPRSIYDPQQLYSALERYATDWSAYECTDDSIRFGFRKAYKIFAKPEKEEYLSILPDERIPTEALKLSKSSGLPLMTSKKDSLTYSFDRESQVRKGLKAPNPCVAYARTSSNNKTRLVWGYPLEMTIMESRFARPLISRFSKAATPMAFAMPKLELGAKLHRYVVEGPGRIVCLDYSKFDSTLSAVLIKEAFRILATWFSEEDKENYGWKTLVTYFIHTPIVMPDGHLYTGKNHGVPSGSYFTQMVDSICNVILMYSLCESCGVRFNPRSLYVLGDDVIVNVSTPVELETWANTLASHGVILHDDEKTVVDEPHFLGAYWYKGKPDAHVDELVNKACFPEKFRDYQGKPDSGAENVLRSYASSYLSAFRFLPRSTQDIREIDMPQPGEKVTSRFVTGSDKYLLEERGFQYRKNLNGRIPALSVRLLL